MTQPVVRYQLDDVLVARHNACPCGSPARALSHIEGRCDDQLALRGRDAASVPLFSDLLSRALAQVLPASADYRLVQTGPMALSLCAALTEEQLASVRDHLANAMYQLGVDTAAITWSLQRELPAFNPTAKRRRIVRAQWEAA